MKHPTMAEKQMRVHIRAVECERKSSSILPHSACVKICNSIRNRSACCMYVCVCVRHREEHFILTLVLLLPIRLVRLHSNSSWHWIAKWTKQKQQDREQRKRNEGGEGGHLWEGHQGRNHMLLARKIQLVFIYWQVRGEWRGKQEQGLQQRKTDWRTQRLLVWRCVSLRWQHGSSSGHIDSADKTKTTI